MDVLGKVVKIAIDVPVEKKDGGSYPGWKLVYEDNTGEIRSIAKHMNSLKYNKKLKAGLESLQPDDEFTLTQEKNDGGYWDPKSIVKGKAETTQKPTEKTFHGTKTTQASSNGSNWPTAEERKATQTHIIRQNCVTNAVNFHNIRGDKKVTEEAVIKTAARFEEFIHNGVSVISSTGGIENMEDDLPFESGVE